VALCMANCGADATEERWDSNAPGCRLMLCESCDRKMMAMRPAPRPGFKLISDPECPLDKVYVLNKRAAAIDPWAPIADPANYATLTITKADPETGDITAEPMRTADPVAAVERGRWAIAAADLERQGGMEFFGIDRADGGPIWDEASKGDIQSDILDSVKRIYSGDVMAKMWDAPPVFLGPEPTPPTLADFTASIKEHLEPLLPKTLRCVTDQCGAQQADPFVLWVLDAAGKDVVAPSRWHRPIDADDAEDFAQLIANTLMKRSARCTQ
jgi:hypothetical protein